MGRYCRKNNFFGIDNDEGIYLIKEYVGNTARIVLKKVFDSNMIKFASNNEFTTNQHVCDYQTFLDQYTLISHDEAFRL